MSEAGDQPNKMVEIAGLAAAIADRILEQHEAGTSIPPEQFRMLVHAARMLFDNDVAWPSVVEHVIMGVARRAEEAEALAVDPSTGSKGDNVVVLLAQGPSTKKRA